MSHLVILERLEDKISKEEMMVLQLLVDAYSNEEIASKLSISINHVEQNQQSLLAKMGVNNVVRLVRLALEYNLVGR